MSITPLREKPSIVTVTNHLARACWAVHRQTGAAGSHRFEENIGASLVSRAEYKQISPLIPISRIPHTTRQHNSWPQRLHLLEGSSKIRMIGVDTNQHQYEIGMAGCKLLKRSQQSVKTLLKGLGPHRKDNPHIRRHEIVGLQDRILNGQGPNHWIRHHNTLGAQA